MKKPTPLDLVQLTAAGIVVNRLRAGAQLPEAKHAPRAGSLSIVIPARNEEGRLTDCVTSALSLGADEVIVVDDQSTDDTAALARKLGATVVEGRPLPEGWVGKPWALQQGLEAASGDVVLFLDADTQISEGLVERITGELADADVVSLTARFRCDSVAETALHTSMLTTLVYRFGPPGAPATPERALANGQCFAARRSWLQCEGGFFLVRSNLTDDISLARALQARGGRVVFRDGEGLVDVDMHESVGDVWQQWGRSLPMNDVTPLPLRLFDLATLWLTQALPVLRLLTGRPKPLDWALLAMRSLLNVAFGSTYRAPAIGRWLSPLSDLPAVWRLTEATIRPVRSWRGRHYRPDGQTRTADR